ncbi:MAG: hypothetical protein IJU37_06695 [Desulfovibrio sp.]|nr:hypothetical protein [Desulfovibrio sp.]
MVHKLLQLLCWIAGLWFFFAVVTPWLYARSPAWQRYYQVQDDNDLHSGALYYSDVPVTLDSELKMRESVREGMQAWRQRHSP